MTTSKQQRGFGIWAISLVAVGFGLLTIKEGGTILFGGDAARASAGNYVPFVLWFNFLAGFAYVVAGAGLWLRQRCRDGDLLRGVRRVCRFRCSLRAAHRDRHELANLGMGDDCGHCLARLDAAHDLT